MRDCTNSWQLHTNDHAVAGDPRISSVTDPAGTITTATDWAARPVAATDVWGFTTTVAYDDLGRVTTASNPAGVTGYVYDVEDRVVEQTLNGRVVATPSYDTLGRMNTVTHPNSSGAGGNGTVGVFAFDDRAQPASVTWTDPGTALVSADAVTARDQLQRVVGRSTDGHDPNGAAANYTYSSTGELVTAVGFAEQPGAGAATRTTSYAYAATGGCGLAGAAGRNVNRTAKTITPSVGSPLTVSYCYDHADRLTGTDDPLETVSVAAGTLGYDAHGNTSVLGDEAYTYDIAGRHFETGPVTGSDVVLMVGNAASLSNRDTWLRNQLQGTGWTVTIIDDDNVTASSADGAGLVVISESVGGTAGSAAASVLASVAVPVISAESYVFDELGMTGLGTGAQGNTANDQDSIDITEAGASHPLGGQLGEGNAKISDTAVMGVGWGTPAPAATVAATVAGQPSRAAVFGYDTGDVMVSGSAPARRVGWLYYGGNGTNFNSSAAKLFHAAVQWAANTVPTVAYVRDAGDVIVERTVNGIVEGRYAGTAGGAPSAVLDDTGTAISATITLPGGTSLSFDPRVSAVNGTWHHPNLTGHRVAVTTSTGAKTGGTTVYDPDGNLAAGALPNDKPGAFDAAWHGGGGVNLEHQPGLHPMIQMGARQYSPILARFLQVDPIEGGVNNDYGYVSDSINQQDLTGMCGFGNPFTPCGSDHQGGTNLLSGLRDTIARNRHNVINIVTTTLTVTMTVACIGGTAGAGAVACVAAGVGVIYMTSASAHALAATSDRRARSDFGLWVLTQPIMPIAKGVACASVFMTTCAKGVIYGAKPGSIGHKLGIRGLVK